MIQNKTQLPLLKRSQKQPDNATGKILTTMVIIMNAVLFIQLLLLNKITQHAY